MSSIFSAVFRLDSFVVHFRVIVVLWTLSLLVGFTHFLVEKPLGGCKKFLEGNVWFRMTIPVRSVDSARRFLSVHKYYFSVMYSLPVLPRFSPVLWNVAFVHQGTVFIRDVILVSAPTYVFGSRYLIAQVNRHIPGSVGPKCLEGINRTYKRPFYPRACNEWGPGLIMYRDAHIVTSSHHRKTFLHIVWIEGF